MKNVVAPPYWTKRHHYTCKICGSSFSWQEKFFQRGKSEIRCPKCDSAEVTATLTDALKDVLFDPRIY